MADFCKQCSIENFGQDFEDLANLSQPLHTLYNLYPIVLCEGCGGIQVDHTGTCISEDCLCSGHKDMEKIVSNWKQHKASDPTAGYEG